MSKITDAARGEDCLVRIDGCPGNPEMTIWSHARWIDSGRGKSIKAPDLCGAFACTYCDGIYDGQIKRPAGLSREDVDMMWLRGHLRSLVRLRDKGVIK